MTVFFDIDDTIYSRGDAFLRTCEAFFDFPLPDPYAVYLCCNRRGDEVFKASQTGEISMEEMYIYRYCNGFADMGLTISEDDAIAFQNLYLKLLANISFSETMEQILTFCKTHFDGMGILTNGPAKKQRMKIAALGLERFFSPELIIVSGEVGMDKPEKEIFHLAEKRSGCTPRDLLYIGDSPVHDILPAAALGWKTIWYNRRRMDEGECAGAADRIVGTEEELLSVLPDFLQKE